MKYCSINFLTMSLLFIQLDGRKSKANCREALSQRKVGYSLLRGYVPRNQLHQFRIAGFKLNKGTAGNQEH